MINIPVLRWGQPYTSIDVDEVVHFATGEPIASVSRANGGLIQRDMRKAPRARDVLREIPIDDLIARAGKAGELYMNATLPMGDGTQTPDEFVRAQSASTGLPERMCRANMKKNAFVLAEMRRILTSLTRGLVARRPLDRPRRGARRADQLSGAEPGRSAWCCRRTRPASTRCGCRSSRCRSGSCSSRARRSRGRRTGWRRRSFRPAFRARRSPSIPGGGDVGAAVLDSCGRSLIFGGTPTVDRYRGNPRVQAHGPGFSKILLGDDQVDRWEQYLDVMVDSVFAQQRPRLHQLLRHLGEPAHARDRRRAGAAAGRGPAAAARSSGRQPGRLHRARRRRRDRAVDRRRPRRRRASPTSPPSTATAPRVVKQGSADYLLPTVVHCESPDAAVAKKEYMFPFVTVVECPEAKMLEAIGPTLVCSAITCNPAFRQGAARRRAHRPAEPRPGADDAAQLAAAARGQHHRLPVPGAGVSDGEPVRRVQPTIGHEWTRRRN